LLKRKDVVGDVFRLPVGDVNDVGGEVKALARPMGNDLSLKFGPRRSTSKGSGAQERTRTFTAVKPLAPEASASTNSTTWA
jgi:hypothetical protein